MITKAQADGYLKDAADEVERAIDEAFAELILLHKLADAYTVKIESAESAAKFLLVDEVVALVAERYKASDLPHSIKVTTLDDGGVSVRLEKIK